MKNSFQNLMKFGGIALLILSALYANQEDEKKTPEVLQDILDGFVSETSAEYYAMLNPLLGEVQIFENGRSENGENISNQIQQMPLVDEEYKNAMTELSFADYILKNFTANSVFWLDFRNGEVNLSLFNPEDQQTYNFNVNMPEGLTLDTNASYLVELSIQGDDLRGMSVQSRAQNDPDQTLLESYYINLETLELENYYKYDEVLESLQEEMGNFTVTETFFRSNGLIYMNAVQTNFTHPVDSKIGVIIDTNSNEYRFFPGLRFMNTKNVEGHEVLLYERVYVGERVQRFYGLRDLTENKDLWFQESIDNSSVDLMNVGGLTFLNTNDGNTRVSKILPIYRDGESLVLEEWSSPGIGLGIFRDGLSREIVMNFYSQELVDRYYSEGIRTSYRFTPSSDPENSKESWDEIYNFMEESLNSIGLELRRERIEIINDELLLEEPR